MAATDTLPSQVSPPEFALSDLPPHAIRGVEAVALPVLPAPKPAADSADAAEERDGAALLLGPGAADLVEELGLDAFAVLDAYRASGKAGEITVHPVTDTSAANDALRMVIFVGVGEQRPADLRRAGAALARATRGYDSVATSVGAVGDDAALRAFVIGLMLGSFGFHWRSTGPKERPLGRVVLSSIADEAAARQTLDKAIAIGGAGWRARTLATVPSNLKNPPWLAEQAEQVAAESGLDYDVWDEKRLVDEGFEGILSVGRASDSEPRLIRLDYKPAKSGRKTPHLALIGKGITFDSGGLSIKPGESMLNMKRDMTGGAVVLAVMAALGDIGCAIRVTGLIAAAENSISGSATRPGDVLRHYGGRTTEVTNTDAEGRLVMADALAYSVAELKPDALVDVATLTGAMKLTLGMRTGGIFANHDGLADAVRRAGEEAGEPFWRMPLADEYEEQLASKVADADNGPKGPGAIMAALFLQHFVGDLPWAHLDIASAGDSPSENYEWSSGPTGFGARALLHWLEQEQPLEGVL
ncbi:leucyl aminopeptidase family protein [Nocardioides speluncae]|uniref:leucyl aminopeptidase family protein n=1 Tax=Nocardioides speluncae TaxID=2670337 RepID=UPI001F0B8019|nr:leucyl aminopeptidase family protein [Nocardioides speluncae]